MINVTEEMVKVFQEATGDLLWDAISREGLKAVTPLAVASALAEIEQLRCRLKVFEMAYECACQGIEQGGMPETAKTLRSNLAEFLALIGQT